jgi:hypothetical protein
VEIDQQTDNPSTPMMQEVLSKTDDPNVPLQEQEFYELRLDDLGFLFRPGLVNSLGIVARNRFIVRECHAAWSEIDRIRQTNAPCCRASFGGGLDE